MDPEMIEVAPEVWEGPEAPVAPRDLYVELSEGAAPEAPQAPQDAETSEGAAPEVPQAPVAPQDAETSEGAAPEAPPAPQAPESAEDALRRLWSAWDAAPEAAPAAPEARHDVETSEGAAPEGEAPQDVEMSEEAAPEAPQDVFPEYVEASEGAAPEAPRDAEMAAEEAPVAEEQPAEEAEEPPAEEDPSEEAAPEAPREVETSEGAAPEPAQDDLVAGWLELIMSEPPTPAKPTPSKPTPSKPSKDPSTELAIPMEDPLSRPMTEDDHRFTPRVVNLQSCKARTWGGGYGGQCKGALWDGADFCGKHTEKWVLHGRVDGPIPEKKLREFIRRNPVRTESRPSLGAAPEAAPEKERASRPKQPRSSYPAGLLPTAGLMRGWDHPRLSIGAGEKEEASSPRRRVSKRPAPDSEVDEDSLPLTELCKAAKVPKAPKAPKAPARRSLGGA